MLDARPRVRTGTVLAAPPDDTDIIMLAPGIADFEIDSLGLIQRILVTTDGTVTDMLAVAFLEPIALVLLDVTVAPTAEPMPALDLPAGATVMRRRVVLRGGRSGVRYVYAETNIAADRLAPELRDDLLAGRTPLGQLWLVHRVETWKERPRVTLRPAGDLAGYLDLEREAVLIARRYRAFVGGGAVFDVTEYFPRAYLVDPPGPTGPRA